MQAAKPAKMKAGSKRSFKLIKWDAEIAPEPMPNPESDPRCAEIVEWELGGPTRTTYKRDGE